ncbi:hypothetical protein PPEP_a1615 [Pseudoalteromonas peptidolytica F12-50-A1]|uniref:Uncharacterized protein n=1 Tax=Pseudoalteromonas peptidolytica F12-50-A1 TaxID=1315280 RepID=A0A8I0T5G2_9GAMM|nr:hypothetical protein [Pseudoalteromonas peptidolytica F12-50-A1]
MAINKINKNLNILSPNLRKINMGAKVLIQAMQVRRFRKEALSAKMPLPTLKWK